MSNLKTQLIRLAYEVPEIRKHLLPLITASPSMGKRDISSLESKRRQHLHSSAGEPVTLKDGLSQYWLYDVVDPRGRTFTHFHPFYGRSTKPMGGFSFPAGHPTFVGMAERGIREIERHAEEKAMGHDLVPGDILSYTWGFEQTNADFYEVIKASDKFVTIRELETNDVSDGPMSMTYKATPIPGRYKGPAIKAGVGVSRGEVYVKMKYGVARKWDGKPVRGSSYA